MSLQRSLVKLCILTKFGEINCSSEVIFCLYEKYEILLILRDIVKISYFHEFATDSCETSHIY